jgi:hypothetical protein
LKSRVVGPWRVRDRGSVVRHQTPDEILGVLAATDQNTTAVPGADTFAFTLNGTEAAPRLAAQLDSCPRPGR